LVTEKLPVVIIGAGVFQLPAIIMAKKMGFYVVAIDGAANAVGFKHADKYFVADIKNAELCIKLIKDLDPVAVFALSTEVAVVTVAAICNYFGLPGITPEAALNSTNKRRMRECFARENLPSPKFTAIYTTEELNDKVDIIGFPQVIKPVDSAGSRGVSIVRSKDKASEAFAHAKSHSVSGEVLIETYMDGVEISVEACVQYNKVTILSLSDKVRTPPPYPLDTRVIFPSDKEKTIQDRAKEIAERAIHSCGIDNAVIHIEMMVTSEGPKLVELAARGAGFHVFSKLLSWVCNIDTVKLLIDISLGRQVELSEIRQRGAVLSFPGTKPGVIQSISGLEEVRQLPGVEEANLYVQEGDAVRELRSGADRIGHIITFGIDRQSAVHIADEAEKELQIEVA